MSIHVAQPRPWSVTVPREAIALASGGLALALMVAGGALPWLVLFHGLTVVRGFALDGGLLGGVTLVVVALLVVMARNGSARVLRPVAVLGASLVIVDSLYSGLRIASYAAAPGPAGALTAPVPGVGPSVFVLAGGALLVAAISTPAAAGRVGLLVGLRATLTVSLIVAGTIHLLLTPEHLGASVLLGTGFLLAGVAQLALAGGILFLPERSQWLVLYGTVVVNVALIGIYAYAVLVGLPLEAGHAEDAVGLTIGRGEPVDVKGGLDLLAEVAAVVLAVIIVSRAGAVSRVRKA
ncbi:hypothetical protein ACFRFH_01115 [Leifsonia sp. NPDC056824]|uniref:hypothetical protein n=1 Tax=Leifsonia sp. NPDC056824 TaxID=3345953 RepID=UPI0036BB2E9F